MFSSLADTYMGRDGVSPAMISAGEPWFRGGRPRRDSGLLRATVARLGRLLGSSRQVQVERRRGDLNAT